MERFEKLLEMEKIKVERFIKFKISSKADAEDVLQEVYITAYEKFNQLKNESSFKPWILSIARNKCTDYYRKKLDFFEIPIDSLREFSITANRKGISIESKVRETLNLLPDKEKQILYLYFIKDMPQSEIAKVINIPIGTVKSRLFKAKQKFKENYPYHKKGENTMKKFPEFMPKYRIEKSNEAPFDVKWEELMGWFLVPKLNEKLSWAMYDMPSRKCISTCDMKVTGKAKVHGIEGVELTARETSFSDKKEITDRTFIAQLTDTHCRYLATLEDDDGVKNYITFLDGNEFMPNWGFGEENCGNETNLSAKGDIKREGNIITSVNKDFLLDIVGRYKMTIENKSYDTVCVMDIETYNPGVISEQF